MFPPARLIAARMYSTWNMSVAAANDPFAPPHYGILIAGRKGEC